MRRWLWVSLLLATCVVSASAKPAEDPNEWVPDDKTVGAVDAAAMAFDLPAEFGQLSFYHRFYWGTVINGRRVVEGVLLTTQLSAIVQRGVSLSRLVVGSDHAHIIAEADAPGIADGGCMIVYISYDVEQGKITDAHCNGEVPPPPPHPG